MKIKKIIKRILSFTPKCFFNFVCLILFNQRKNKKIASCLDLNNFSVDKGKSCIKNPDSNIEFKYDLQIIVPCYNIEKYGKRCIDSIVNQKTKHSFYLVLINDGSTDNTKNILEEYKENNIEIINKINGGISSARNAGLRNIYSKYLMFVDSDDYLIDENVVENMLNQLDEVKESCKNIIIEFSYKNSSAKQYKRPAKKQMKSCKYIDLTGFPWAKIYSSSLFKHVEFPEDYWFEDTVLHEIVFPMADQCYKSNLLCYFYQLNDSGATSQTKHSQKTLDTFYVTRSLLNDRKELLLNKDYNFFYRFYVQTICNCNRLLRFDEKVQIQVFIETKKLFEINNVQCVKQFKTLYKSLKNGKYKQYVSFCKYYSLIYLNLD